LEEQQMRDDMKREIDYSERAAVKVRERVSQAERARATREAIFLAAAGRGEQRWGAYPILLDSPFGPDPHWDPVRYTKLMIEDHYPVSALSQAEWNSIDAILRKRVQEILDQRAGLKGERRKRKWSEGKS
jgi:hypothetical protein